MATTKPRITVTLDQRTYNVLKSISDCGGQTMSGFVSDLLDAAMPTLERMAVTFQAIKEQRGQFLASVDRAQVAVEPVVMAAVGQYDLFVGAVGAIEDAAAEMPIGRTAAAVSNPRPVTRGSTPLKRKKSAASTTTTKARSAKASGRKS